MVGAVIHVLERTQVVQATLEHVWEFFSDPGNLNLITPPDMHFEIFAGGETVMYPGQLIEYRVSFIQGVRSTWLTEIAHVRAHEYFVDEQRVGPYCFWYHEHFFARVAGGVQVADRVSYVLPFGLLGELVHSAWVRDRLAGIFDFRREAIAKILGGS